MKRTLSILLLGLALIVSGCGGDTTTPTSVPAAGPTNTTAPGGTTDSTPTAAATAVPAAGNGQAVEVSFYYPVAVGGPVSKIIQGYADTFNAANPGIHVTPVFAGGYADVLTKIQTTLQGGGAPPEVAVLLSTDMQTLIDSDAIVPFDEYIKAAPDGQAWLNDFYPAFMANSQEGGHTYGIPFQRSTPVLYYNKDMFKAAGLDPATGPQTWDDLVAYGKKLTKLDSAGNGAPWGLEIPSDGFPYWLFQGFAIENGHNVVGDAPNKVSFNDPSTAEALQFFVDLSQKDNIMPKGVIVWNNTPTDFTGGKAAMIIHTTGSLTNILKTAKFEVGVSMLPKKQQFGAPTGGGNFYLFKDTGPAKRAAAWKFIQFMTSPEQAAQWSIDTGYIASRKAAYDTPAMKAYTAKTPQAVVARDQLQYAAKELTGHNGAQIQKILGNAVQAAITGKKQPQAALDDAQKEADQLLSQFSK